MTYRMKDWTGPCQVKSLAAALVIVGLKGVVDGTEHVYWNAEGETPEQAGFNTLEKLKAEFGTTFGLKPSKLRDLTPAEAEKLAWEDYAIYEKFYPKGEN